MITKLVKFATMPVLASAAFAVSVGLSTAAKAQDDAPRPTIDQGGSVPADHQGRAQGSSMRSTLASNATALWRMRSSGSGRWRSSWAETCCRAGCRTRHSATSSANSSRPDSRGFASSLHRRQQQSDQDADDCNYHQ